MGPLWSETVSMPRFEPLPHDRKTDVLIIGGGITGILCAYALTQAGVDCVLVEAARLCGGTTGHTTAKLTSQHGLIYQHLLKTFGAEKARLYWEANESALARYRALAQAIDCDLEERDSFVYSLDRRDKLDKEMDALARLNIPAELIGQLPLPFPTAGAVRFPRQAQFHPLKFLAALAQGLPIHEDTKVLELLPGKAVTNRGTVQAENILVATHFPLLNKHGSYFLKLYQSRSYVLALKGAPALPGMYVDESGKGLSFRMYRDLLLLGGGGHPTGKKGGSWPELTAAAREFYPKAKEVCRWAAQDCMPLDGLPYIGPYSASTRGLYVATGFQKWGMTTAMAAAGVLTDWVLERKSPYQELFSPSRSILHPQLGLNALNAALHLATPTVPRCPHMGCALKYDPQEHVWACPCHGSRFAEDGTLLDGPATGDLRLKTSRNKRGQSR